MTHYVGRVILLSIPRKLHRAFLKARANTADDPKQSS